MDLICRTCSCIKTNFVHVFCQFENNKLVSEMLSECTSVETRKDDGLPPKICTECLEKLITAWCFRTMTIETDLRLRKTFSKYGVDNQFQNEDYDTVVVKEEIIIKDELPDPLIVEENESLNTSDINLNYGVQNHTALSQKNKEINKSDLHIFDSDKKKPPPVTGISQVFYLNIENSALQQAQQHVNQDNIMEQNYILKYNQNIANFVANEENMDKSLWKFQSRSLDHFTEIVQDELSTDIQLKAENYQEVFAHCKKKDNVSLATSNEQSGIVPEPLDVSNHISQKETFDHNYSLVQAIPEDIQKGTLETQKKQLQFNQNEHNTLFKSTDLSNNVLLKDDKRDSQEVNTESTKLVILGNYRKLTHKEKRKLSVICKVCNKIFKYSYYSDVHVHQHKGNLPFKCNICGKCFNQHSRLKLHEVVHSDARPYSCDICGKNFKVQYSVQIHKTIHANNKPHKCNICHLSFRLKSCLEVHMKRHKNQKEYMCEVCGKTFIEDGELRSHMKSHLKIKDFLCSLCGKVFANSSNLYDHYRHIHTNERPYVCNHCDRRFKDKSTMDNHALIHTGEKPHTCKLCSKSFRQSVALRTHMRTHTGETPFACKLCPLQFKYKHLLSNHMKVHK